MLSILRMFKALVNIPKHGTGYFVGSPPATRGKSKFRKDIHTVVGGALVGAFVVASLSGLVQPEPIHQSLVVAAAVIGGVLAKYVMI